MLFLDNFEQVAQAGPQLGELLASCPSLKVLVTSRAELRLYGEHEFPLEPLTLPSSRTDGSIAQLRESEAVRLFEERAQAADPSFLLSAENAAPVSEICRRLDGLPLALELAAARVRLLPPAAMLSRLDRRLPLLVGGARGIPERQRTLRDAIDWSYSLLSDKDRVLFRQLGVFVGGWILESAGAVICAEGGGSALSNWTEHDLMDGVQSLLNKSLLRPEPGSVTEPRFGMLETIAEYAVERLQESGESDQVLRRHAAYYIRVAEQADAYSAIRTGPAQEWFERLEREHDNLRRALRWCLDTRRIEAGFRLAAPLWWFWATCGHLSEGRALLAALLSSASRLTLRRAQALRAAGSLAFFQADLADARRWHEDELAIQRNLGDPAGTFAALDSLAMVAIRQGDTLTARAHLEEQLTLASEVGGQATLFTLVSLANIAHEEGDNQQARTLLEEAVRGFRASDWSYNLSFALLSLGTVAQDQGDHTASRQFSEEALAIAEQIGARHWAAACLVNLGRIATAQSDFSGAQSLLERALLILVGVGDSAGSAAALERFADLAAARGHFTRTLQLAGAATSLREMIGLWLSPRALAQLEVKLARARRSLDATAAAAAWDGGRRMSLAEATTCALERSEPEVDDGAAGASWVGSLTPREQEVAALIAGGLSNSQIAKRLVISPRTADNHLQHIFNKLGLGSRAELAAWVVEHRLHRSASA